jgi:hypothetical protein
MSINIIEAYIKIHNQLIIYISTFPNIIMRPVIENLGKYLKLKVIYQQEFMEAITTKLDDVEYVSFYDNKQFATSKFNSVVLENCRNGVIIVGNVIPTNLLKFKIDYHIHLSLNKKVIVEYYNTNDILNKPEETSKLIINKVIYPFYMETLKEGHINIFINSYDSETNKIMTDDDIEEKVWNTIINYIQNNLRK